MPNLLLRLVRLYWLLVCTGLLLSACNGGGAGDNAGSPPATQIPGPSGNPVPPPGSTSTVLKPRGTFASAPASASYNHPQLRGVLLRASWRSVEPTPGGFDFAALKQQVATLKAVGKPWSLAIGAGGPGSPAWLMDELGAASISYLFRGEPTRLPLFWDATVQQRLQQLAQQLAQEFGNDSSLQLVYIPQMSANGIEGHLQGVDMAQMVQAGYSDDVWVNAAKQTAKAFADAFAGKALAFEVHEINNSASVPSRIINDLWNDISLQQRVGAAMWWISGRSDYQAALLAVLADYPGDIYGQVIGRSDQSSRFGNNDYGSVFSQAKLLGLRYIEPWEYEFGSGSNSANGAWDATFADFNNWANLNFP